MTNFLLVMWILIGISTLIMDLVTSSFMFIWFTIGSIASIISWTLGFTPIVQIITFISVSALFMAVGYPLVKKTIKATVKRTPTMEEGYIGREFILEKDVMDKTEIKFDGIYWTVMNTGMPLKKGQKVKVTGIEGNKLLIKNI